MTSLSRRSVCTGAVAILARVDARAAATGPDVESLWPAAERAGVTRAVFERELRGFSPDPTVLARAERQTEFTQPIGLYVERTSGGSRLARGRAVARQHLLLLDVIERRYGVPPAIIVALWGMESDYGAATGSFDVVRSLATLALAGSRGTLYADELAAALRLVEAGDVDRARLTGSWAGAMGQVQFLPSSYARFAVDADGDGRRDIWSSVPDVLASVANFMATSGWRRDILWGGEVRMPDGLDLAAYRRPLADWTAAGVRGANGAMLPDGSEAALVFPAGIAGPAFLLTENFEVLRAYNTSDAYALAAGRLADRIAGGGPLVRAWPAAPVLTPAERREVHRLLAARGWYAGTPDGKFGAQTREAVRRFQVEHGLVPDGYADPSLLRVLRTRP